LTTRNVVFISHANPEQNAFTIWLGAKLAAAGYEVWADVLRLRGGQDWQRRLEDAIRDRACKVLFAADNTSAHKRGVRNELQIASDTARKIKDADFIIPLRLHAFEAPFLVVQSQYIDFENSWASGLKELLQTLEAYQVPRTIGNTAAWLDLQLMHGRNLTTLSERLISTWLEVRHLPAYVHYHVDPKSIPDNCPNVPYKDGILTCARDANPDLLSRRTADLLKSGWPRLALTTEDARKRFSDIANQALAEFFKKKPLASYEMSDRQVAWWVPANGPEGRVPFRWPGWVGRRQIQGISSKRKVRWHFGVSASFRSVPFRHFRLKSRLIFTEDGSTPLQSSSRAHRLRRSFAKGWRNARWRDMLLSFLFWLGDGTTVLDIPVAQDDAIVLSLLPNTFSCPVSVEDEIAADDEDEDDPDPEFLSDEELEDETQ
jgi:hypothetical protein